MFARCENRIFRKRRDSDVRFKNERGITLLEVTTVMVIAGVLSYAAMVHFSTSTADVQARAAARLLMQDVRQAQQLALTTSRSTKVEIDVQSNRYSLKWNDNNTYMTRPMGGGYYIVRFGEGEFPDVQLISTALASGIIAFDASGRPLQGQQLLATTATLAALSNNLVIRVTPNTGRLELIE